MAWPGLAVPAMGTRQGRAGGGTWKGGAWQPFLPPCCCTPLSGESGRGEKVHPHFFGLLHSLRQFWVFVFLKWNSSAGNWVSH